MTIFNVFTLLGGLAFFLFGMNVMSDGLEKTSGGNLERMLKKMTSNPVKSLILGAGVTAVIQSSSAVTVMLVGLVNSGLMTLSQSIGVIMGSNIGTTITAWILSLAGIESDNVFISLLKPSNFAPLLAFLGIMFTMLSKSERKKDIGGILLGFAILMYGMELMGDSVEPLSESPQFSNVLTYFKNPILSIVAGAIFTGIIQSSSASVGILQALSLTGSITYSVAVPIIMGQNIGTCITALISSIGVSKNAKRVSVVHFYFNIIGTVFISVLFYGLNYAFKFPFINNVISPFEIAVCHSIFNIITTVILLPFTKQLEKLAVKTVKDNSETEYTFIDERLLLSPPLAVSECMNQTVKMSQIAKEAVLSSFDIIKSYSTRKSEDIKKNEDMLDNYEDKLGTYLIKLSAKELSEDDSKKISMLLHTIGNFERLGDHAVNLMEVAKEINDKKTSFSEEEKKELEIAENALKEILELTMVSFDKNDLDLAVRVEPLEEVIDEILSEIKARQIKRLREGKCTIEFGFILSDMLSNFERISDHCSNIAVSVIEINHSSFDTHEYLGGLKKMGDQNFKSFDSPR